MNKHSQNKKKAVRDKMSERIVNQQIMPNAIKLANANFNSTESKILLTKFQAKTFDFVKTQQSAKKLSYLELTATDTGLVMTHKKDIVVSVHLDKQRIITLTRTEQYKKLQEIVGDRDKKRKETFFFHHASLNQCCWGNNEEMRDQMKSWRRQKKEGTLEIKTGNNREFMINGKMWYILVVQDVDEEINRIDPLGFGVGFLVPGMVYWFSSEVNRDTVVSYVMK